MKVQVNTLIKAEYFINAIRSMGLQAIMEAKQGHPGMVISAAPINYSVYVEGINIATDNPQWINRDRFVLSAGHGSMSLYPILHFCRLIDLEQIKNFRQKISGLPGHPENIKNPYIEATTGPLGQGIANAVGMAIAEAYLSHQYKKLKGLIDHYTFAVVGDGDLQEGISYEAMSLAGKLNLNKLIILHDSNNYQLETSVKTVNNENIMQRVQSMNWNYQVVSNEPHAIMKAIKLAKKSNKPSFIEIKTIIGEGLSYSNSFNAHGGNVNHIEIESFNKHFNCNFNDWNFGSNVYYHFYKNIVQKGNIKYQEWNTLLSKYKEQYPELVNNFLKQINNEFIDISKFIDEKELPKNKATRVVAGWIMQKLQENKVNDTLVLSPDVAKSTNIITTHTYFNDDKNSNMIMVGIREFGMLAIQNGIQLHGGLRSISSVFLAFSDYLKSALRLSCISEISPIIVFTHDSVAVGSDGPTHQPIEQLGMLRSIPHNKVFRPCDEQETFGAFCDAFNNVKNHPVSIVLSRQNLQSQSKTSSIKTITEGGYIIAQNSNKIPHLTICATGSEVQLALKIMSYLENQFNLTSKVLSIPNLNKFLDHKDLQTIIESEYGLVSIEASNDANWYKLGILTKKYCNVNVDNYGYSIDGENNYQYLGLNVETITYQIINSFFKDHHEWLDIAWKNMNKKTKELKVWEGN